MRRSFLGFFVLGFLAAFAPPASASGITFDANLANPAASGPDPNFYNGSGNPNGGFTVDTEGNIEIGLRAKYRQNPAVIDSPTNVYSVVSGFQTNVTSGGNGANGARAAWSFDFSIDAGILGDTGGLKLSDLFGTFRIDDFTKGTSVTFDPLLGPITDNSTWGPTGKVDATAGTNAALQLTQWGAQNSENMIFGFLPGYNVNDADYYGFTLTVNNRAGAQLAQSQIFVSVDGATDPTVPEPTTLVLLGIGLVGVAAKARKRNK